MSFMVCRTLPILLTGDVSLAVAIEDEYDGAIVRSL
jgi:hypothetical protein